MEKNPYEGGDINNINQIILWVFIRIEIREREKNYLGTENGGEEGDMIR